MGAADRLLRRFETSGIRLGLDASRRLLSGLGDPHRSIPSVLVAGTNGKGSTSALLSAMMSASGYRVGLFTSPHLEDPEERIRIDGEAISDLELARHLQRVVDAAQSQRSTTSAEVGVPPPTYFEAFTLAAFLAFSEAPVDLAVLEVGLGGRLDSTNVAEPLLSLITEIAFDHQSYLGHTLAAIATEKAGILRPRRPALSWISADEAFEAVEARAREIGALHSCARDQVTIHEARPLESSADIGLSIADSMGGGGIGGGMGGNVGQRVLLETDRHRYDLRLGLSGGHQVHNLALAVRGAETLAESGFPDLQPETLSAGVAACRWPGRLEPVELPDGKRVLLDGGHNLSGAEGLARYLAHRPTPYRLLFGAFADKDIVGMLHHLAPPARGAVLTEPPETSRALPVDQLLACWRDIVPDLDATPRENIEEALSEALDALKPNETLVVCGSLYLVGAVRRQLRRRYGTPPPARDALWPGAWG